MNYLTAGLATPRSNDHCQFHRRHTTGQPSNPGRSENPRRRCGQAIDVRSRFPLPACVLGERTSAWYNCLSV